MTALTGGSLCSGSGGLDLGLERALGIRWLWHCENDEAASEILDARWPGVPNYGDLVTTDWSLVERPDLLAAGFPCPDYSLAGRRKGIDGAHGQIWHGVANAIRVLRPTYLVLENVDAIRNAPGPVDGGPGDSALGVVLADLADLGYRWAYDRLRAADVGAPHGRLRWFCVACLAPDAVGVGEHADGRVRGGDAGATRPERPSPSDVSAGASVVLAADAVEDDSGAAADAADERRVGHVSGGAPGEHGQPRDEGQADVPGVGFVLLPTPTAMDGAGSRNSTARRRADSTGNVGDTLTDAVWKTVGAPEWASVTDETPRRLLPTPQAADGVGGRMEKGAMANAGVRPSGHKATLPLPTAVEMREDISESPFAQLDGDESQLALLPTPTANEANPGAGGELRAAIVHGEGRRNETGVDTLGRPNLGRPGKLLPTPDAQLGDERGPRSPERAAARRSDGHQDSTEDAVRTLLPTPQARDAHGPQGNAYKGTSDDLPSAAAKISGDHPYALDGEEPQLLPTPTTQDANNTGGNSQRNRNTDPLILPREFQSWDEVPGEIGRDARARIAAGQLLPTPQAADGERASEQGPRHYATGADNPTLLGAARRVEVSWGVYEAAVRRWEDTFGEEAPAPTDERGRLAPDFVRWMLGYPPGWFDLDGLKRTRKLRCLGNSVQVQAAEVVGHWLRFLVESGLLRG